MLMASIPPGEMVGKFGETHIVTYHNALQISKFQHSKNDPAEFIVCLVAR